MAKKKYLEESERKLIESVNNAYIPTDWDEFEKRYHEMERYGDGKPRKVDKEKMEYIEDGLVSRGVEGNQLSSLLSTIVEESGGNPFSVDDSGKFRGLIQFSKERYPEKDFDRDKKVGWKKAIDNQLDAIVDHLNEYGGDYGFLDGGDGSGYMTGEEAKDAFWGRDSDIENVTRALTYGFVRPGDRSGTTENRTRVARLINEIIQPPVETPDVLEFDYDGKHYRAETPEEVTPEMRRALMLSKLVGEKNRVELQDPLYTTFDEAYGRAKGKGASVFMWNGKKYSTKEDGGEAKKDSNPLTDAFKRAIKAHTNITDLLRDIIFGAKEEGQPTRLNKALFAGVDPRDEIPDWTPIGIVDAIRYAWGTLKSYINEDDKNGLSGEFKDLPIEDRVAINAWAKYNNLPYDDKLIIDNGDGTFRLPEEITKRIRTDRDQIQGIYDTNKRLLEGVENKYSQRIDSAQNVNELWRIPKISEEKRNDPEIIILKTALEMDKDNLAAMDTLEKKGRAVFNEFNYSGRNVRGKGTSPLNVLKHHTLKKDENGNFKYRDIYDFWPLFDAIVRGNVFNIEGDVPKKKDGGKINIWTIGDEEDFQKWYAKIAEHKGLNPNPDDENQYYDYRTFWLENPEKAKAMLEDDPGAHFTDRYKYPGHPTFSNESMYSDEEHPGGYWETVDGVGYYVPSEYTKSYIDRTIEYLAGQNEGVYIDGEYKLIPKMPDGGLSRLAPQDNTSVGRPGSADVQPIIPSDAAKNNPVVSTIASFTPIVGEMLDIRDLYTSLKNNDKAGVLLALTGLVPVIGGVAGNVIKKNNPFWRKKIFSPEELAKDEELISKFPDYAHPNSPMGASVLNHEERLANGAFRKFRNIPAARVGVDPETGNIIYDFNGLDFNFIDVSNSDELKKVAEFYGTTPEEFISGLDKAPFFNYLDHVFIDRKLLEDMADTEELQFRFRDGVPSGSPQEEVLRSHEINHLVNSESKRESAEENGFSFDWLENNEEIGPGYDEYFRVNDNTEIAARGSQIKDYFGLTSPEQKITPEMLEYAARHYIFDYGVNNDMDLFFRSIKDYDKAAKWINKYATAGLGAYWLFDRTSLDDDDFLNGGPIKFARRLNGDSIFERNMISPWKNLIDKPEKKFPKRNIKMPDGGSYNLAPRGNTLVGRPGSADASTREDIVDSSIDSLMSGVFDEHRWVVKRIGNEEFYTNSPLLKTLPSMSREDVALSLLPPELWPGVLKRKEDVTGKSARRHFVRGGEVSELQDYIYDRLTKEHGIAPIQAIGIVANLTQESALDYDALGDNGRSYGIQQWQGDRRKNLFEFAKKRGRDEPALDDQVDFLVEEYKGDGFLFPTRGENMYKTGKTDKDMFDYFQYSKLDFDNAANIYDSTRAWAQGFGRGNKNFLNMDRRFHIAKTLSSRYNIDAGGQSFYTDMGYKDEWGSPVPEVAVSAEKKAAQDDWMEKYGNKMLASILAGDGEGGDTHVTNNYYVNEEGLSEDEKRNAAEVRELQQKQQTQELLASIIDGIKLDIKGVTEVRKR